MFLTRSVELLLLLAALLLISSFQVLGDVVTVDGEGNIFDDSGYDDEFESEEDSKRLVTMFNKFSDQAIHVFWDDQMNGGEVELFTIEPQQMLEVSTTTGHAFHAVAANSRSRALPYNIVIERGIDSYAFSPVPNSGRPSVSNPPTPPRVTGVANTGRHADIDRNYLKHPATRPIGRRTTSMAAKFRCLVPKMDYWYDDGGDGVYQGTLTYGKESTTNTYEGHVFYFTEPGNKSNELARFTMDAERVIYAVSNPKYPITPEQQYLLDEEYKFMEEYKNRTGIHWRHFFGFPNGPNSVPGPRGPPTLHMHKVDRIGDTINVSTPHGHWHCKGTRADCQSKEPLHFTLTSASLAPRVFVLENFLSEFEADELVAMAQPKVKESFVGNSDEGGGRTSDTRTSRNTWIPRQTSDLTETLSRRAADVLGLDEKILWSNKNVEDLQVVSYENGQKYDSHHDWGVSGRPESRYITLLLYLSTQASPTAGGETAFPKGNNGLGYKLVPKKGNAAFFYNLLDDGNGDDLSLHAALPCVEGKKWLANYWVWDPRRKD